MSGTNQTTDPQDLIEQYLRPDLRKEEALKLLKITPEEYSRLLASRTSRVRR